MSTPIRPPLGKVIAQRRYRLHRHGKRGMRIEVRVGCPIADPNPPGRDWACPYEITVSGKARLRAAYGVDMLQALELVLKILPSHLASLARQYDGEIHLFGALDPSIPRFKMSKRPAQK